MTCSSSVPSCCWPGVPLKVRFSALKLSHPGSSLPSAKLALSPKLLSSGSLKVLSGTWKLKASSSVPCCSARELATSGGSLTSATLRAKLLLAVAPSASDAVTASSRLPSSASPGVLLKVRFSGLIPVLVACALDFDPRNSLYMGVMFFGERASASQIGIKLSYPGSSLPSERLALKLRLPSSGSLKVPSGT